MKPRLLVLPLLALVGCASARPLHLSVPLTTGETVPVVLHAPKAWACDPIAAGNKRYIVPGQTRLHIEEESRGGVWL